MLLRQTILKTLYRRLRTFLLIVVIFAFASLGIYGGHRAWTASTSDVLPLTISVQPRDFALRIPAYGELQSAESLAVAVPNVPANRLRIASVVPDGRHVEKGDQLVDFDPTELDLEAMEHRSNLDMADQKISKSELATNVEKTDIIKDKKIAELELQTINEFLPKDEQIYSRREIIEGQIDKNFTEKKIVFAEVRLQLKGKVYSLDEAILMLERQQAKAKIGQVEKALASLKLLSPGSGVVVYNDPGFFFGDFTLMPGWVVWVGMTLFNLVNPDQMDAKCFVLEKDAGELRIGQAVNLTLDPFPGLTFTGKVKSIDKLARPIDRDSPVKYFQTLVSIDKTDRSLMKPGVKLKAQILAGELKSVLVLPRSAVIKKDSAFFAYVQRASGKFELSPVTLGQGDLIQAVVKEGLQPGQVVALNPPDVKQSFTPGAQKQNKS